MKKIALIAAMILGFGLMVNAGENVNVPAGETSNPINADYGGVDIATNSFVIGLSTVPSERGSQGVGYLGFWASTTTQNNVYPKTSWRIYGVNFSTGLCNPAGGPDFISIQTSSSTATQATEVTRFYNHVFVSTMTNGNVCGGVQYTRWPIRVYGNLFWGVNFDKKQTTHGANPYNRADLLYWREP